MTEVLPVQTLGLVGGYGQQPADRLRHFGVVGGPPQQDGQERRRRGIGDVLGRLAPASQVPCHRREVATVELLERERVLAQPAEQLGIGGVWAVRFHASYMVD